MLIAFFVIWLLACPLAAPAADAMAAARTLAFSGKGAEALDLLGERLATEPDDADARTLRGIILSWEGRYDDARGDLEQVLAHHHDYSDALRALINVELWSGHPERAEVVARGALRHDPTDSSLLLGRAKALHALGRSGEALGILRHLTDFDPGNSEAVRLERDWGDSSAQWTASFDHSTEWFSDSRVPWREEQVQVSRNTGLGNVAFRFDEAYRFSMGSRQAEIDAYPHIRPGTYAFLNLGYSPDARLYPRYRMGAELYQSLGHGWEASGGVRWMHLGGDVRIYTPSFTRYYGNWMMTGRLFLTPGSAGTSRSVGLEVRRYFANGTDYCSLTYGHGSSPAVSQGIYETDVLQATSLAFAVRRSFGKRLSLVARWGVSREDRVSGSGLRHYLAETGLYYRM